LIGSLVAEACGGGSGVAGEVINLPGFVSVLLADLTPRPAELVVIGAADSEDGRVERDIESVMSDGRFCVFDLRGAPDVRGVGALASEVGDAVRLLLVDGRTAAPWRERLARAFLDGDDGIDFGVGRVERPRGRSVVIVW